MGVDYALALIFVLTMPGETAASCKAPSEPVQERLSEAPVRLRVPETPDVMVATSKEAPDKVHGQFLVIGHQDDEACSWTATSLLELKWQEDRVRGAVVALH